MPRPRLTRDVALALTLFLVATSIALGLIVVLNRPNHHTRALLQRAALGTPDERHLARTQLLAHPARSAPLLVRTLRRSKTRWRVEFLPWLEAIPQISAFRDRQLRLEGAAVDLLQRMGPDTAPALLPLLAENRFGGRDTALALLRSHGPTVCPLLIRTLHDPDPDLRAGAAMALGLFPAGTLGSLAPLHASRRDPHPSVRTASLWALAQFSERPAEIVPALTEALDDPAAPVRRQAIESIRGFPAHAAPAVEPLRRILRQDTLPLRIEARRTLALLGPEAVPSGSGRGQDAAKTDDDVRPTGVVRLPTR